MGSIKRLNYNLFMYPFERILLGSIRRNLIKKTRGHSLEIGFGTGVNLKYYDFGSIDSLVLLEQDMSKGIGIETNSKTTVVEGDVLELPFDDKTFDTIVFTLVFCSVDNPSMGLAEIRRVLKDDGNLIFIEHVTPRGETMRKLVNKVNKTWNSMSKGCNLNRDTVSTIVDAGFIIDESHFSRNGVFVSGMAKKEGLGLQNI